MTWGVSARGTMPRPQCMILPALLALAAAVPAVAGAAPRSAAPKCVIILHSFGLQFQPYATLSSSFRTGLAAHVPYPVEFHDIPLEIVRSDDDPVEEPLIGYLRALNAQRSPDLVVAVGAPAFNFCLRRGDDIFSNTAILGIGVDGRFLKGVDPGSNVAVVPIEVDLVGMMDVILQVLPTTKNVYVVFGNSPLERYWAGQTLREWQPFIDHVAFTVLNDLTLPQILERTASLPPHSAVVLGLMEMDAAGVPYERNDALEALHGASNAPIFGFFMPDLGHGIVGGRLIDTYALATESVVAAEQILNGIQPAAVSRTTAVTGTPVFDAVELKRWNIAESLLPPGSEVRFRHPGLWRTYRTQIIVVGAVVLIQTLLIGLYLTSRIRLRLARAELADRERSVQELRGELSHASRVSLLGQFTASLAHELGQPLGAILRNAEAAELFLKRDEPDMEEVESILTDVRHDAERSAGIIGRLRELLSRHSTDMQPLLWDELVREVVRITRADARARGIVVEAVMSPGLPALHGDRINILQVLLNLVSNAMDAVESSPPGSMRVVLSARSAENGFVECAVHDSGSGMTPNHADHMFEPFVTTKERGMGMGLPISRAIVETHGGRLWAERNPDDGMTFRFTIPVHAGGEDHA